MKKKKSNEMDCTDGILSPDGILFTNYSNEGKVKDVKKENVIKSKTSRI